MAEPQSPVDTKALQKTSAEMVVLALLEERSRHGYELAKLIESRSEGRMEFHVASLYPMLYRLEAKGAVEGRPVGALDGVTIGLPAMTRALKLQRRAARVGFDWPAENALAEIEAKLAEEMDEIKAEMASGDKAAIADECGDLLFVCVNLLRHLGVDPESALRSTNAKFERRFRAVEDRMKAAGFAALAEAGLDRLEAAWQAVKAEERQGKP